MYKGKLYAVANAKCPYFLSEYKTSVTCEGLRDGSRCIQKFDSEQLKDKYIESNCLEYPNGCLWANAMERKYDEH